MPIGRFELPVAADAVNPAAAEPSERADEDRTPLDFLLDVGVFAPLGFALEFRKIVPEMASAGRRQLAFSQSLGKAALAAIATSAVARQSQPDSATAAAPDGPAPGSESGVVAGYDQLTARDVIASVGAASPAQVEWLCERAQNGKARKTVMVRLERAVGDV